MKISPKYGYYKIHYIEVPNDTVFFLIGSKMYIFQFHTIGSVSIFYFDTLIELKNPPY